MSETGKKSRKVLAVASGGGHWEQLMMLRSTLDRYKTSFATTERDIAAKHGFENALILPDCNQNQPLRSAHCAVVAAWIVLRTMPDVMISTGAAPGFFCIIFGRLVGAKNLWIDSVANGERLSMCGRLSKVFAHECLSQWEHLSRPSQPKYRGSVL